MDPHDVNGVITLDASHRALITAHLKGLDADDRINRFCCVTGDDLIEQYVANIRYEQDIVLGSVVDGRLVGFVHAAVFSDGKERLCEIGISVDAALRKSGIGKRMLQASIDTAHGLQIRRIYVQYMTSNGPMAALARSAGGRLERDGADASAVFESPAPKPAWGHRPASAGMEAVS